MFRHKYMKKLQLMIAIKVNSLTAFSLRAYGKLTQTWGTATQARRQGGGEGEHCPPPKVKNLPRNAPPTFY